jgi:hypothetical protein
MATRISALLKIGRQNRHFRIAFSRRTAVAAGLRSGYNRAAISGAKTMAAKLFFRFCTQRPCFIFFVVNQLFDQRLRLAYRGWEAYGKVGASGRLSWVAKIAIRQIRSERAWKRPQIRLQIV